MDHAKMGGDCSSDGADQELHVLAVDDNLVDRKVIERLLKISCCKVTTVESGARALQYLGLDEEKSSEGFDVLKVNLIMTDYSMPGMTGFELLQKIKASAKLKQIPVVIMSSENIIARIDRCLEEGAEDYLLKPVRLSDVQRVRACILAAVEKKSGNGPLVVPSSPPGPLVKLELPPTLDSCDTCPVGPIAAALNCESPMPPIPGLGLGLGLGPGEPRHQLHVKCPGLVVASD